MRTFVPYTISVVRQLSSKFLIQGSTQMPRKIRELISDLEAASFVNRGGKGDHRNFVHPKVAKQVTIAGKTGADAKHYQEEAVRLAIEESRR